MMHAFAEATRSISSSNNAYHLSYRLALARAARPTSIAPFDKSVMWYRCAALQRNRRMEKWRMEASSEGRKFLNPAFTFDRAWSAERAHRPRDGSMHIRT